MQLALDNALAPFFENNFGFGITKAANLAAIFGMMNFFSRPLSGLFSDLIARRYGMRGRIWWLWFVVAAGGEPSCPQNQPSHELRGVRCQATGFRQSCVCGKGCLCHAGVTTALIGVTHENFGACMAMVILSGIFLEVRGSVLCHRQ